MPNFILVFQSPSVQLLPLDTQGHEGDVEEYDDTIDHVVDNDDGQDQDHQNVGDQIDDVSASPLEVEEVRSMR